MTVVVITVWLLVRYINTPSLVTERSVVHQNLNADQNTQKDFKEKIHKNVHIFWVISDAGVKVGKESSTLYKNMDYDGNNYIYMTIAVIVG